MKNLIFILSLLSGLQGMACEAIIGSYGNCDSRIGDMGNETMAINYIAGDNANGILTVTVDGDEPEPLPEGSSVQYGMETVLTCTDQTAIIDQDGNKRIFSKNENGDLEIEALYPGMNVTFTCPKID